MENNVQNKISWKSDGFLVSASVFNLLTQVALVQVSEENTPSHSCVAGRARHTSEPSHVIVGVFLRFIASSVDQVIVFSQLQREI